MIKKALPRQGRATAHLRKHLARARLKRIAEQPGHEDRPLAHAEPVHQLSYKAFGLLVCAQGLGKHWTSELIRAARGSVYYHRRTSEGACLLCEADTGPASAELWGHAVRCPAAHPGPGVRETVALAIRKAADAAERKEHRRGETAEGVPNPPLDQTKREKEAAETVIRGLQAGDLDDPRTLTAVLPGMEARKGHGKYLTLAVGFFAERVDKYRKLIQNKAKERPPKGA